jgi:hypothetical protein
MLSQLSVLVYCGKHKHELRNCKTKFTTTKQQRSTYKSIIVAEIFASEESMEVHHGSGDSKLWPAPTVEGEKREREKEENRCKKTTEKSGANQNCHLGFSANCGSCLSTEKIDGVERHFGYEQVHRFACLVDKLTSLMSVLVCYYPFYSTRLGRAL